MIDLFTKIFITIIIVILLSFIPTIFWINTNTNFPRALHILRENGYRYIEYTGYKWFKCAHEDWSHTGFIATNIITHKRISGTICCGLIFKNCTIRFD